MFYIEDVCALESPLVELPNILIPLMVDKTSLDNSKCNVKKRVYQRKTLDIAMCFLVLVKHLLQVLD